MKIAHRDLKPENVLLFKQKQDTNFTLKLCDFGLAEEATSLGFTRVCGSPSYVAPEILEFKSYGLAVDIWSMGILFYLIICKYVPFEDTDMNRKFELIMKSRLEFPEDEWSSVSKEAKQLIGLMLEKNPRRRIKAGSVFHNKWFRGTVSIFLNCFCEREYLLHLLLCLVLCFVNALPFARIYHFYKFVSLCIRQLSRGLIGSHLF